MDAERRRLSLSLKRVDDGEAVQPRADGQPLETPSPPQIDLSEDVFPEGEAQPPVDDSGPGEEVSGEPESAPGEEVEQATAEEATDEALAETPVAESTSDIPAGEGEPEGTEASLEADIPAGEPEVEPESIDASIEADAVDPTHQGRGDSEGHAPYAPDEAEQEKT